MLKRPWFLLFLGALAALRIPAAAEGIRSGPYLADPTPTSITVCWVSDEEAAGTVWIRAVTPDFPGLSSGAEEKTPARYHRVRVGSLLPATRYEYMVECGRRTATGTFVTAPPPGRPFRFVAYGDNRTQPDRHAEVVASIRRFRPDLIVSTGDLVARGNNEAQWREFFEVTRDVLRETPFMPARGNHEGSGPEFGRYFDRPHDYSFDYGDAHFVALDTNRPEAELPAQEEWLRRDLEKSRNARWRVVFMHHTPHTCTVNAARREESARRRARLEPILKAGRVQIVFSGHDHNYQRHETGGIQYVVTGGGGAPLYDVNPDTPFVRKAAKAHHSCEVTVNGGTMTVRVVEPDGRLIEQFEVRAGR